MKMLHVMEQMTFLFQNKMSKDNDAITRQWSMQKTERIESSLHISEIIMCWILV